MDIQDGRMDFEEDQIPVRGTFIHFSVVTAPDDVVVQPRSMTCHADYTASTCSSLEDLPAFVFQVTPEDFEGQSGPPTSTLPSTAIQSHTPLSALDAENENPGAPAVRELANCQQNAGCSQSQSEQPTSSETSAWEPRRINKELLKVSKTGEAECAFKVLELCETHLYEMNGVNLSTALHRIAKVCQNTPVAEQVKENGVFQFLVDVAENMTEHELQYQDGTMPVSCSTIIAWSCASLRVFRPRFFSCLGLVASRDLGSCQSYEITNMLWAFAELCKREPQMMEYMSASIQLVCEATALVFQSRPRSAWKFPVLVSALVSLSKLPFITESNRDWSHQLVMRVAKELALSENDARPQQRVPLVQAFDAFRISYPEVFQSMCLAVNSISPTFQASYMFGGPGSKPARSKHLEPFVARGSGPKTVIS